MSKKSKIIASATALAVSITVFSATPALANENEIVKFATNSKAAAEPVFGDKTIKDIEIHGNEVYTGYGNGSSNIGPIDLISNNLITGAETNHITMQGEEIGTLRTINGNLYAPNLDPNVGWTDNVGYTSNESGTWKNHDVTPFIHVFDVASTGDDLWLSGSIVNPDKAKYGNSEYLAAVKRSVDGGATWTIEKTDVSDSASANGFDRYYWLAEVDGKIYASAKTNKNSKDIEVWENGVWRKEPTTIWLGAQRGNHVQVLGSTLIIISGGGLSAHDTKTGQNQYTLPFDGLFVRDVYIDEGSQTAYALIDQQYNKPEDQRILESKDGFNWSERRLIDLPESTTGSTFATSIAVKDGVMYFGASTGEIYKQNIPSQEPAKELKITPLVERLNLKDLKNPKAHVEATSKFGENITNKVKTKTVSKWNGTKVQYTITDENETVTIEIPVILT